MGKKRRSTSKPVKRRVLTLAAQGEVTHDECNHSYCKPVRTTTKALALANYSQFGVPRKQINLALRHLPALLCSPGKWPPPGVNKGASRLVYGFFVIACLEHGAEGLQGQKPEVYNEVAEKLRAADAGNFPTVKPSTPDPQE